MKFSKFITITILAIIVYYLIIDEPLLYLVKATGMVLFGSAQLTCYIMGIALLLPLWLWCRWRESSKRVFPAMIIAFLAMVVAFGIQLIPYANIVDDAFAAMFTKSNSEMLWTTIVLQPIINTLFWNGLAVLCADHWVNKPVVTAFMVAFGNLLYAEGFELYSLLFLLYLTGNLLTLRYRSILPAIVLNLTFYTCNYLQTVAVELLPNVSIYFLAATTLLAVIAWVCVIWKTNFLHVHTPIL